MRWCESLTTTREYELAPGESAAKAAHCRTIDERARDAALDAARHAASWVAWREDRDKMAATQPWHAPASVPAPPQAPPQAALATDITEPRRLVERNRTRLSARFGDESYIPPSPAEPAEARTAPSSADVAPGKVLRWDAAASGAKFQSPGVVCRELVRACARTRTVHS